MKRKNIIKLCKLTGLPRPNSNNILQKLSHFAAEIEKRERKRCWHQINSHIKQGPLPGEGWDKTAERNGLILAANIICNKGI